MPSQHSDSPSPDDTSRDSRDFDYGVGDDLRLAQQQVRAEVAARIREVARLDPTASRQVRCAYERAALLAEGRQVASAWC